MRRSRFEWFAVGILVGAFAGFALGLLLAPAAGAKTRRRLADSAGHLATFARGVADMAEETAVVLTARVDHYLGRDQEVAWRKVHELREGVQRYTRAQTEG